MGSSEGVYRKGYLEGELGILRRWIESLPEDSELALRLAEEFRRRKTELVEQAD